jgi:2-polyprenyl-3-methyl-5-hydroxy-6-metoxy-1,4-benzoquinol methylase
MTNFKQCRVCLSKKINIFKINHFYFPQKKKWKSYYCLSCGAVSEFKEKNYLRYDNSEYRNRLYDEKIHPPIAPWSHISFLRWKNIYKIIKPTNIIKKKISYLDYGGYNGFLAYAFKQINKNINTYVADYDPNGLKIAKALGNKIINLKRQKIKKKFNLITIVMVLEHLDKPKETLQMLKNKLHNNGLIYAEVPNLLRFPLSDEAHKITFSEYSLKKLFIDLGFEIIHSGFHSTVSEANNYGYYLNSQYENLNILVKKNLKKTYKSINKKELSISVNTQEFENNLVYNYSLLMFIISFRYLKKSLKLLKSFILILSYALIDYLTIRVFKKSIISFFYKKN